MQQTIHPVTGGPLWVLAPDEEYFDKFVQIFGSNNHSVCFLNEKEEIVKIVSCEHEEIIYVIKRKTSLSYAHNGQTNRLVSDDRRYSA